MSSRKLVLVVCSAAVVALAMGARASATINAHKTTYLTFSQPVRLPGISLGAGTYIFETATVTDDKGRFVSGLRQEDFIVYEDNQLQTVSHFSNERVPVSLGIALDTSGSMTPDKMSSARGAISRFYAELLGEDDEMFLYRFADVPQLVQDWTSDRRVLGRAGAADRRRRHGVVRRRRGSGSHCRGRPESQESAARDFRW